MGYQNIGSPPRFYIDYLQYAQATGNISTVSFSHIGLNASGVTYTTTNDSGKIWIQPIFTNPLSLPRNDIIDGTSTSAGIFVGCLGHNLSSAHEIGMAFGVSIEASNGVSTYATTPESGIIANWGSGIGDPVPLDGFTLLKKTALTGLSDIKRLKFRFGFPATTQTPINLFAKTVVFGQYFNCPVSPDLSLSMSHEYDGIKQVTTKGGSTLSNANYISAPKWGEDREAWQLGDFPYYYNGRRNWDLSFSYISDSDIEPYSYYGNKYDGNTHEEGTDNWFQNVLYYTMGGHLPFIFCPDPSIEYYYDPDLTDDEGNPASAPPRVPEFAICRFDMSTFKREQVANNVYNMKVKIVESW